MISEIIAIIPPVAGEIRPANIPAGEMTMKSRIALTNQDLREGSIGAVGATISAAQTSKRGLKGRLLRLNVEACESGQVQVISAYHR